MSIELLALLLPGDALDEEFEETGENASARLLLFLLLPGHDGSLGPQSDVAGGEKLEPERVPEEMVEKLDPRDDLGMLVADLIELLLVGVPEVQIRQDVEAPPMVLPVLNLRQLEKAEETDRLARGNTDLRFALLNRGRRQLTDDSVRIYLPHLLGDLQHQLRHLCPPWRNNSQNIVATL